MDRVSSKFLLNFAYIGTRFFGVQKQTPVTTDLISSNYDNTVQMAIELGLCQLNPPSVPWPTTGLLSRTDAGVHASQNYIIVGLNHPRFPKKDYDEEEITSTVNNYFRKNMHEIAIKSTHRISDNYFSMKPILFREYKYWFCLNFTHRSRQVALQACDFNRFSSINLNPLEGFNLKKMKEAFELMKGQHNFKSFESTQGGSDHRDPVREVTICDVEPYIITTNSFSDEIYKDLPLYEVTIRSSGFLYKQVRRMVGIGIMVALGRLDLNTVRNMIYYPHPWHWSEDYFTAPSQGLFLNRICFKGLEEIT